MSKWNKKRAAVSSNLEQGGHVCVRPESRLREMETNNQMAGGLCQNQTKAVIHHANRIKKMQTCTQTESERRTAGRPSIHAGIISAGEAEGGFFYVLTSLWYILCSHIGVITTREHL